MACIADKDIPLVETLYTEKEYSARQIAEKMGVPLDAVYYAMRKHSIHRRSSSENSRILFKNKPPSYKVKQHLNSNEQELKAIGTTLYWAEGYKTEKSNGIDFANCDVSALALFIRFLREICGVQESRLRIFIYCYSNQDVEAIIRFWSKKLNVPKTQFTKPYIRSDFKVEKKDKMPYGLVHIRYADKKLLWEVLRWIEEYKEKFCVGTQAVNGGSL